MDNTAARTLWRNPGFTVTALAMLSLGVGTVSALFSVVDKVLLEPLPYPEPERLVQLITTSQVGQQKLASIPQFVFWRDTTSSFESLAASDIDGPAVNLTEGPHPRTLQADRVSANYFQVFGAHLALGRPFSESEDGPNGAKVAIVSSGVWHRDFLSDATIAGRAILIDGIPHQVVGVVAADVHLESAADIWLPLCADKRSVDHIGRVRVVGRLRRDTSLQDAQREVSEGQRAFLKRYPPYSQFGAPVLFGERFEAIPLRDAVVGDIRPALYFLMGAVAFVLAISCTNTATLLLARASRRTREIAVRMALGAGRGQVLAQLLAESLLLALAGGVFSIVLGHLGVRELLAVSPGDLPRIGANASAIVLDWRVVVLTLFVSAAITVLCALAPALHLTRTDVSALVKDSTAQSGMRFGRDRWRSLLMIAEMSLALALLAGAGLMIRTMVAQRAINRGFDENNVVTVEVSLNGPRFEKTTEVANLVRYAERRMEAIPGVTAAAATSTLPLIQGLPLPFTILKNDHFLLGRYDGTATWRSVSPQYFKVFAIRLLRGRVFTGEDSENAAGVAIVNRAMVRQYWQDIDAKPIGEFITIGKGLDPVSGDTPRQVVGVVADVRDAGLDREPCMYVPIAQVSDWMNARNNRLQPVVWAMRTDGRQPSPAVSIQQELAGLSGGQPLGRLRSMHAAIAASSARTQFYMTLLVVFAGIAVLLTAAGLYGLMAYSVQQRRRELAIRAALGATPGDVRGMVVTQALRLALGGTLAGIPLALALSRVTIHLILGIRSWDPVVFGLVVLLLCAVTVLAAFVPSVRASRVNPAIALRSE